MDKDQILALAGESARTGIADFLGVDSSSILVDTALQSAMGRDRMTLYNVSIFFANEMERCLNAGAFFAGCVAGASATEAILTLLALQLEEKVAPTNAYKDCKKFKTYRRTIADWKFDRLIKLSEELEWIPADLISVELTEAIVSDFPHMALTVYPSMTPEEIVQKCESIRSAPGTEVVRLSQDMRNLIHAPRWLKMEVPFDEGELTANCKLAMIVSAEVAKCLLAKFAEESAKAVSLIRTIVEQSSAEELDYIRAFIKERLNQ